MAEGLSSLSLLPWIWSIEALASHKEVDVSFIHDVIEMAPPLPDGLGKNMREMVALRCLEDLYGSSDGSTDKVSLAIASKVGFHPSESCESVLHFISGKTPSNLRVTGAEQLKLDIHSFIMHKRDSMAKCTLQRLKDSILGGTNKYVDTSKGISGLACDNESQTVPSHNGGHNVLPQMLTVTRSNGGKPSENVPLNLNSSPFDRYRFELGAGKGAENTPESRYALKDKKRKYCDSSAVASEYEPSQKLTRCEIEKNSMCPAEPRTLSAAPQEGTHNEIHESNKPRDNMDDHHEKIDVVMPKNLFLSSGDDCTKRSVCVKCNEVGELLVCRRNGGVHLEVHEDCLGMSARFDKEGNFCCPFCTYSAAISEYLESKKTTSLARKRLASFMSPNFEHRSNGLAEGLHMKEGGPRQGED